MEGNRKAAGPDHRRRGKWEAQQGSNTWALPQGLTTAQMRSLHRKRSPNPCWEAQGSMPILILI